MAEYIRIACGVPAVAVGDPKRNAEAICAVMDRAEEQGADLLVLPELTLTGCSCGDLFFQDALIGSAQEELRRVVLHSGKYPALVTVVGLPMRVAGRLYSCMAVVAFGEVCGIVPKTVHGEESRWFTSGEALGELWLKPEDMGLSGGEDYWSVTVSTKQLFRLGEDAMLGIVFDETGLPGAGADGLWRNGAELLLAPGAVHARGGERQESIAKAAAFSKALGCVYAAVSPGCGESVQDAVCSGRSVIAQCGEVLRVNEETAAEDYLLVYDCDLEIVRSEQRRLRAFLPVVDKPYLIREPYGHTLRGDGTRMDVRKQPFLPAAEDARKAYCREVFQTQVTGLKRRLEFLGAKAVIGVSGGLDSTLALLVAAEALRQLGRPMSDLHGITMPCFGTSRRTHSNARCLMELLGITTREIDIRDAVSTHLRDIGHDMEVHNATYENAQARERTQVLMDYAGMVGGIVVGTGDLSELALGWCTYNGDHMSMYAVNSSIPKTMIPGILEAALELPQYASLESVLRDILDTPISPELLPPDADGAITQDTQDLVGPYALHDFFLYYTLRYGFAPKKVYAMACRAFGDTFDGQTVKKWLTIFCRRFFSQQFKRSCMPEGVAATELSLSPRSGCCFPGDTLGRVWIEEAENL